MKKGTMNSAFIAEIIPIILILLFILYTKSMIEISYTVLGKLLVIILIVGYTIYDVLYGLVMCMMIILYYQLDYIENMENIDNHINNSIDNKKNSTQLNDDNESIGDYISSNSANMNVTEGMATYYDFTPTKNSILGANITSDLHSLKSATQLYAFNSGYSRNHNEVGIESMTDNDINPSTKNRHLVVQGSDQMALTKGYVSTKDSNIQQFKNNYCRNNQLHYKEFPIRNDAVEHVFPEIKFNSDVCNPCDPNCQISFINNKIDTESQLVLPKSSNDSIFDSWKDIFGKDNNFFPKLENITQNFAIFT